MAQSTEMTLKYESNEVRVRSHDDGALSFSSDGSEHFIYLYPHQLKLLKAFLADLDDPLTKEQAEALTRRAS